MTWLAASQFAALAGISPQKARKALQLSHQLRPWRRHLLTVRLVSGRGGRSGLKYEVLLLSLPAELQERHRTEFDGALDDAPPGLSAVAGSSRPDPLPRMVGAFDWRLKIIAPAIAAHHRGDRLKPVLDELASQVHNPPDGSKPPSASTLRKWVKRYSKAGWEGLKRRGRSDKGKPRRIISKEWDAATEHLPLDARHSVRDGLLREIRSLWAVGVRSRNKASNLALRACIDLTRAAGLDRSDEELKRICRVPQHLAEQGRDFGVVHQARTDAKRFDDERIPSIRRRPPTRPLQCVFGDVKPLDFKIIRPDGSEYWPRMITWYDWSTTRAHITIPYLSKGEGVRQTHIAASLVDMMMAWGVPESLYLDNGAEYGGWDEDAKSLMLLSQLGGPSITFLGSAEAELKQQTIIRARPYNARAKAIEGFFAVFDQYLSQIPGYLGGDRMKSKTANKGKPPPAYPGSFEDFCSAVSTMLDAYHATPHVAGPFADASPQLLYGRAVASGFEPVVTERENLEACFGRNFTPKVRARDIRVDGRVFADNRLIPYAGKKLKVRLPFIGRRDVVAAFDPSGRFIGHIREKDWFAHNDPAGAAEQGRAARQARGWVSALARQTDPVDLIAKNRAFADLHPAMAAPPSGALIEPTAELAAMAADRKALPAPGEPPRLFQGETPQMKALRLEREARQKRTA